MTVLIASQNKDIFRKFSRDIVYTELTENTSRFICTSKDFDRLMKWVKVKGYNPFALMSWKS